MLLTILSILLKTIGIILLILLILILLILLVPIRYQARVDAPELKIPIIKARVSWFLRIIMICITYIDETLTYEVKLFGFIIKSNSPEYLAEQEDKKKQKEEKEKTSEDQPGPEEKTDTEEKTGPEEKADAEGEASQEEKTGPEEEAGSEDQLGPEKEPELEEESGSEDKTGPEGTLEAETAGQSNTEELSEEDILAKQAIHDEAQEKDTSKEIQSYQEEPEEKQNPIEKGIEALEKGSDAIESLCETIQEAEDLYDKLHGEALIRKAIKLLEKLLRHILPRKISGYMKFGFDDPALTGYATGFAATLYPVYGTNFTIEPDFYEVCFKADCEGSGRIQLMYLLYLVIWLLIDKDVRRLIRYILKRRKRKSSKR